MRAARRSAAFGDPRRPDVERRADAARGACLQHQQAGRRRGRGSCRPAACSGATAPSMSPRPRIPETSVALPRRSRPSWKVTDWRSTLASSGRTACAGRRGDRRGQRIAASRSVRAELHRIEARAPTSMAPIGKPAPSAWQGHQVGLTPLTRAPTGGRCGPCRTDLVEHEQGPSLAALAQRRRTPAWRNVATLALDRFFDQHGA